MKIEALGATEEDLPILISLYREMEVEQTVRKPVWAETDGLDKPFKDSLSAAISESDQLVLVGVLENVVVGLLLGRVEEMLGRAEGSTIGRVHLIYTDPDARGVGVGHAMLSLAVRRFRAAGVEHIDAPVGPGQREAKNFFESHGLAARSIIMYTEINGVRTGQDE